LEIAVKIRALLLVLLAAPVMATPQGTGLKITKRYSLANRLSWQDTQYFQNDRRRSEHRTLSGSNYGPPLALITRCDTGQMIELNPEDKQYDSHPIPKFPSEEERRPLAAKYASTAAKLAPTVLVEVTTVDTGERKKLFGYEARHVVTREKHTRLNGSKDTEQETVKDAWYADLPIALSCFPRARRTFGFLTTMKNGQPADVPSVRFVGEQETGFALSLKTTTRQVFVLPDGVKRETTSTSGEDVTELYTGSLDPGLFEIPRGFTKVDEIRRNPPIPLTDRVQMYWNALKQRISRFFS
jgi:hypothetical protein